MKFWNYEAEGIVPFVANSPFMSFFYTKSAPEYKEYKLKEGEFDEAKHQWHEENNTYGFSHGLGILIMTIGILTFLGIFSPKIGLIGAGLAIIMTLESMSGQEQETTRSGIRVLCLQVKTFLLSIRD